MGGFRVMGRAPGVTTEAAGVATRADTHRATHGGPSGPSAPPREPRLRLRRAVMWVAPAIGLALVFGVWEIYVRIADLRRTELPTPSSIFPHIAEEPGFYTEHALITLEEAAWGFLIAFVVALAVGTFMAHSRFVERASLPVIVLLQSTPVAVLAPVFLIWFGISAWPKIMVAALFCFVPFVINAFVGLRSVDPDAHELMRSVAASRWEIFWKLRFPHSLPFLFSAGRMCIGLSLVGAVIGEMFGGSTGGLGNTARVAQTRLLADQLWGSIFVLTAIGVTLNLLLALVESRVLRWHSSQATTPRL